MVHKKFSPALERSFSLELALQARPKLSKRILKEAKRFKERNSIFTEAVSKTKTHHCCPSCLKAHLIKKSEEFNLDRDLREILFTMVEYETGHYGYYLDGEEIIKI